jgi:hypothetical protein
MQDLVIPNPMQPFIILVQANMALLAKYASPEIMAQAIQAAMRQGPDAQNRIPQSATALVELTQGMMENYTRFMTELTQSSQALFAQDQGAMVQQVQEVADVAGQVRRSKRNTDS